MNDLTWGFVRPKKPSDRQLAYAQSFWICQYINEKYGHDAILKMLAEFKNGKSELILYHYMFAPKDKKPCPMCTMWCDGYDRIEPYVRKRANFVLGQRTAE